MVLHFGAPTHRNAQHVRGVAEKALSLDIGITYNKAEIWKCCFIIGKVITIHHPNVVRPVVHVKGLEGESGDTQKRYFSK